MLRTATGAGSTRDAIVEDDAIVLNPMGSTYLGAGLDSLTFGLVALELEDRTSRTYIRATGTLRTAIATLEAHDRSHHIYQVTAWTEHAIRALADTELTTGAMLLEVLP